MSTTSAPPRTSGPAPRSTTRAVLLGLLAMIVVPVAIAVATNSWSAPGPADHVRMALGSVVGLCVSVVGAWWLAFDRRRAAAPGATWFWGLACLVTLGAVSSIGAVADRLTALIAG